MKRRFAAILSLAIAASLSAATTKKSTSHTNPFLTKSTLLFQAPHFDRIRDSDYKPALETGMKQQIAEIEAIANAKSAPTFDNTILPMEKSGALLTRVSKVFGNLTQSNTNDTLQAVEAEIAPKLAAHYDAIFMNPSLFSRVRILYHKRDSLGLDAEGKYLIERYYKQFIRAGAQLTDEDKATLRKLNQEESQLTTDFRKKVLADTDASAVVVDNVADLAGASQNDIDAAAQRAKEKGLAGKYVVSLINTTQQPALSYLQNRALRERSSKRPSRGELTRDPTTRGRS
jgi:peptidyl-dipeptidase Dcp